MTTLCYYIWAYFYPLTIINLFEKNLAACVIAYSLLIN